MNSKKWIAISALSRPREPRNARPAAPAGSAAPSVRTDPLPEDRPGWKPRSTTQPDLDVSGPAPK